MPPLKRGSKRAADLHPVGIDAEWLFAWGDGTRAMFSGMAEPYENIILARAAWRAARAATWGLADRGLWPPGGAVHDGISWSTFATNVTSMGFAWSAEATCAAVAADVASVEAYRAADPAGAREIVEHLDTYVSDLGMIASIAVAGDERDDAGYPSSVRAAWAALELRRRDGR